MTAGERPEPFSAFTTPEFWDDEHISERMLVEHLDPYAPLASRAHEFIDRSVDWMFFALDLRDGSRVLDLGCGPGLYAERLARRGVSVTGVDVSRRSLAHAAGIVARGNLSVELVHGNYLDRAVDLGSGHDAAILIFEDYCALSPEQRMILLERVRVALRPDGKFLFDVTSASRFHEAVVGRREEVNLMDGFWSAEPYRGVHETWTYPEQRLVLDRYTIETADETRTFWNWMQCLTPDEVGAEVAAAGFAANDVYGDVAGGAYAPESPVFGVLASRVT